MASILSNLMNKYKRLNPEISQEAKELKLELIEYNDKKQTSNHDPSGREKDILNEKIRSFLERVQGNRDDSIESLNDRVQELLKDWKNWDSINKAYKIVSGKGYPSSWVVEQLKNRVDSVEIKDKVCDYIETAMGHIIALHS